jgi:hypothetical protein
MLYRVVVRVIQPREVRSPMGEQCIPVVVPDPSLGRLVKLVDPSCQRAVQRTNHAWQRFGILDVRRSFGDEVIMIRKHRPCLKLPPELLCDGQQAAMEPLKPWGIPEEVLFEMGGSGDEIDALRIEQMRRCVRPWRRLVREAGHEENVKESFDGDKKFLAHLGRDESGAEDAAVRGR